jgi:hypothetical protein
MDSDPDGCRSYQVRLRGKRAPKRAQGALPSPLPSPTDRKISREQETDPAEATTRLEILVTNAASDRTTDSVMSPPPRGTEADRGERSPEDLTQARPNPSPTACLFSHDTSLVKQ